MAAPMSPSPVQMTPVGEQTDLQAALVELSGAAQVAPNPTETEPSRYYMALLERTKVHALVEISNVLAAVFVPVDNTTTPPTPAFLRMHP